MIRILVRRRTGSSALTKALFSSGLKMNGAQIRRRCALPETRSKSLREH